jgi:hypothetical protein
MIPTDLLTTLHDLDRVDKLFVMQFLVSELAQKEGALLRAGMEYPIWSPYDAHEAAVTMLQFREAAHE